MQNYTTADIVRETAVDLSALEVKIADDNRDLASKSTEELQYEALDLQQALVRATAEAKVVRLRVQLARAQHTIRYQPKL